MSFIGAPYRNMSEGLPLEREVIQRQQNHTNKKAKETKQKTKSTKTNQNKKLSQPNQPKPLQNKANQILT